jgi:anaerobic selenocysteine-containing dehydrogenase
MNYGVQRGENGGTAARTIAMLPALTGAWKYRGGGGQLNLGAFAWNKKALERSDLAFVSPLKRLARTVNMSSLATLTELGQGGSREQGLRSGARDRNQRNDGPAVHALFVYNSKPRRRPNHNAVVRHGARRSFTVVHDLFSPTPPIGADWHPARHDVSRAHRYQGAYGHYFVQLSNQAIVPRRSALERGRSASGAAGMGFPEAFGRSRAARRVSGDLAPERILRQPAWNTSRRRLKSAWPHPVSVPPRA